MRDFFSAVTLAIGLMPSLASCDAEADEPSASFTLEFPQWNQEFPQETKCWTDNTSALCPVLVSQSGALSHRGKAIELQDLSRIADDWKEKGFPVLGVAVHPATLHRVAVEQLSKIDEALANFGTEGKRPPVGQRFALMEWEVRYKSISRERNLGAAMEFQDRQFQGEVDANGFAVFVG